MESRRRAAGRGEVRWRVAEKNQILVGGKGFARAIEVGVCADAKRGDSM
jgi:hypothetical protein